MRPWAEVVDRISVILAESRDAAVHPAEASKARRLAEDAYWVEFEASDLETRRAEVPGLSPGRRAGTTVSLDSNSRPRCRRQAPERGRSWPQYAIGCLPPSSRPRGS